MYVLTDKELEEMLSFSDDDYRKDIDNGKYRKKLRDAYRKIEAETNEQIKNAGGMTNWYERGRC